MRVPSTLSKTIRVVPQQERSERRVTAFLDAAAKLWSEVGYDALTMTEVAARSGSSIGALYNYFPDKQSLAFTLAVQYTQALEARWQPLMEQAAELTPREFAGLFLDHFIDFAREYPAFLSLVTAPVRFRRDPAARKASRQIIARAFLAKSPGLTKESAFLCANISLQVAVGMMTLYAEADSKAKAAVVQEFKTMLAGYLETVLAGPK